MVPIRWAGSIYDFDPMSVTDPRFGQIQFDVATAFDRNNCVESLLFLLEGRPQSAEVERTVCATMVDELFGAEFAPQSEVSRTVFRMLAHYSRNVQHQELRLPIGLSRRLTVTTGLTAD